MSGFGELFSVVIDFDKSHLFFPSIIIKIIILLLAIIAIRELAKRIKEGSLKSSIKKIRFFSPETDKFKLILTLLIIPAYFIVMPLIGKISPNEGYGFLISSIIFMFAISFVFAGKVVFVKHKMTIILTSVITPLAAWVLFSKLFFITLP